MDSAWARSIFTISPFFQFLLSCGIPKVKVPSLKE